MSVGSVETHEGRIAALEKRVASLSQSIARFEHRIQRTDAGPDVADRVFEPDVTSQMEAIRQLTSSMFPGDVSAEWELDPECPKDRFLVFHATATVKPAELIDRQRQWQREALRLVPQAMNLVRISLTPA